METMLLVGFRGRPLFLRVVDTVRRDPVGMCSERCEFSRAHLYLVNEVPAAKDRKMTTDQLGNILEFQSGNRTREPGDQRNHLPRSQASP